MLHLIGAIMSTYFVHCDTQIIFPEIYFVVKTKKLKFNNMDLMDFTTVEILYKNIVGTGEIFSYILYI